MPWLTGTALLHSAIVVEKREALKIWTVLLAIGTFSLSLSGTFLVRSGILNSVHAFANDPARGVFILALLGLVIGSSLLLFAIRAPKLAAGGLFAPVSREGALVLNNVLLCSIAAVVITGTMYPLFSDLILQDKLSVGAPFFNATVLPLAVPVFAAMAIGPVLPWKRASLAPALTRLWWAALIAIATGLFFTTRLRCCRPSRLAARLGSSSAPGLRSSSVSGCSAFPCATVSRGCGRCRRPRSGRRWRMREWRHHRGDRGDVARQPARRAAAPRRAGGGRGNDLGARLAD